MSRHIFIQDYFVTNVNLQHCISMYQHLITNVWIPLMSYLCRAIFFNAMLNSGEKAEVIKKPLCICIPNKRICLAFVFTGLA